MKETFYFSHDYGARNDPKLQNVLMDLGCEGIGLYWCLVEMLYEQDGRIDVEQVRGIAFNLHIGEDKVYQLLRDYGLFGLAMDENDVHYFFSNSVNDRLSERRKKKAARSRAGIIGNQKRWGERKPLADESQCDTESSHLRQDGIAMQSPCDNKKSQNIAKESKGKENKVKENKVKEIGDTPITPSRFTKPTLDEVSAYIAEKGYSVDAERFVSYYESNGWKVGRNPMKNWRAAIATWNRTENNKTNGKPSIDNRLDFGRGESGAGASGYEDSF